MLTIFSLQTAAAASGFDAAADDDASPERVVTAAAPITYPASALAAKSSSAGDAATPITYPASALAAKSAADAGAPITYPASALAAKSSAAGDTAPPPPPAEPTVQGGDGSLFLRSLVSFFVAIYIFFRSRIFFPVPFLENHFFPGFSFTL